ncbi:DNA adenine methylase [Desulfosporosinus sp. SYSU MS00001]|uniref:DNA adenine methylase n=1 Tax=Desulfosporosinus sp. SYSU MS00001 TaxID=3416284 RepID=UPI003CF749B2
MPHHSPLRYPGGKNRLSGFIKLAIENLNIENCTYIEPFAGGAGVALSLLLDGTVEKIVINDYDKAIYSFWRAVKQETNRLIERIENTPITIEEWHKQKAIYSSSTSYSLDLAFATLFLNRTNRSGILTGGPIGGYSQDGDWKLDVRFDRKSLVTKIKDISSHRQNIYIYNKDIISLLQNYVPRFGENIFIYFDPPYYNKGQKLYKNFFAPSDHQRIRNVITQKITAPWIITYDDVKAICDLYSAYDIRKFDLTYSAANKGIASELMIFSNTLFCPTEKQMIEKGIQLNFRMWCAN